jgi:DNA-binding transcriptional regulator YiaG
MMMAKNFRDLRDRMTPERRARNTAATHALLAEMSIDELRRTRNFSQEDLAGILEIKQGAVSKQERRPDWHISTLRKYVKAMGGELQLVAKFPDRSISLSNIGEIDNERAASGS